jgi:O-antigen/teichoic acid export membrane protein
MLPHILLDFVTAVEPCAVPSWFSARDLIAAPVEIDLAVVRDTLVLAAPLGFAGLMTAVNFRANLLFLDHFQGPDALATYGAATRVLDLAVNLAVVILWPLIPIFSRSAAQGISNLAAEVRKAVRLLLHLILPLLVASPYLSPIVVRALYGANYTAAAAILDVLAWVGFGVAFALLASYAMLSLRITRYAVRITGTAVIANLVLNAVLVPRYGPMGAAISSLCSEGVLVSLVMLALLRHVPGSIDARAVVGMLAVAAAGALLLHLLVPYTGASVVVLALLPSCYALLRLQRERRRADAEPGAASHDAAETGPDAIGRL